MSRESGARLDPTRAIPSHSSSVGLEQAPPQALPPTEPSRRLPRAKSRFEPPFDFDWLTPGEARVYEGGLWLGPPVTFERRRKDGIHTDVAELVARIRVQAERMVAEA